MDYVFYTITIMAFYAMLAQSLNAFSGTTGLISLVHAGLYGLGAYGWAVLSKNGVSYLISTVGALGIVGFAALFISLAAFRTRDEYFVIITLSIQAVIALLLVNLSSITNGPLGISAVPKFGVFGSRFGAMVVAVASALLTYFIFWRIGRSSWGKSLRAIRDDEILLTSLGHRVRRIKTLTFLLSAIVAGIAGIEYAQYLTFIDPTSFGLSESIIILMIVIVGGLGNVHGAFLAAILLISIPEILRFVGSPGLSNGNIREIIYGLILVVMVLFREPLRRSTRA